jgi:rhamnosyltransferase
MKPLNKKEIAASYGRQIPNKDAIPVEVFARLFNYPDKDFIKSSSDIHRLGIKTFFFPNVFAAVRRDAFEQVGRFPDNIIMNEDVILAAKLITKGFKIAYASTAQVIHSHNYSLLQQFNRYFDIGVALKSHSWVLSLAQAEGEGIKYFMSEIKYLANQGHWHWIPYACADACVKMIGFRLGLIENKLPIKIKKRLSMHSSYWNNLL